MSQEAGTKNSTFAASRLELRGVRYEREGRVVLDGLDLDIDVNRLGIVGRNGSGKSTLARLISGLISPTEGTATLDGANLAKDRRAALKSVGILFQNPDHQIIFPTVLEEMSFGLGQLGLKKPQAEQHARQTLDRFGKAHWAEAYVNTLSQGQKHLLCLMAVVAMHPRLIILDEPFAGLDIPTKAQLERYLSIYDGNLIHITHDPRDLQNYRDLIWIEGGLIKSVGPKETVLPAYEAAMHAQGEADDIADLPG